MAVDTKSHKKLLICSMYDLSCSPIPAIYEAANEINLLSFACPLLCLFVCQQLVQSILKFTPFTLAFACCKGDGFFDLVFDRLRLGQVQYSRTV